MKSICHWSMAFVVLTALMLSACYQMDQETTVYWASCKGKMEGHTCNGYIIPEGRMTFKVSASRQEVIWWFDEIVILNKLTECTVRDKDHWNCTYGNQSWVMDKGNFRTYPPEPNEKWFVISKYKWWTTRILKWFERPSK